MSDKPASVLYCGVFAAAFAGAALLYFAASQRHPALFSDNSVCRAAISMLFGRPVEIISVVSVAGGEILTTYIRPNDGTVWRNRCRVGRSSLVWASETGRWRTDALDEKLTFRFKDDGRVLEMKMAHSDGSANTQQFRLEALQPNHLHCP